MIGLYSVDKKGKPKCHYGDWWTGSAVMCLEDGVINSIGGFGYLLGDEGSAYHLVMTAIKSIIVDAEQQKPHSTLSNILMNHMGISSERELISYVYKHNKTELADIARVIASASLTGDEHAIELLKQEGILLGNQIVQAHHNYIKNNEVIIALRGSFINEAPLSKKQ